MNKRIMTASASLALLLGLNGTVLGADEPASQPNPVGVQNSPSGKEELLMFVDEQELVTATKRPISIRKAPATATIITADDIRDMGARNLLDVLKMVPGFGISTNAWGVNLVEVRGIRSGANEKILVMIDGHSLNRNVTGSALYNIADMLPMENVKQVEIVKGPGSALYGNSAFLATINIITRNAEEINGLEAKVGGGSFDSFKGNMVAGKAIGDKLTISGSLDHYQTNGPKLTVNADALTGTPYSQAPGVPNLYFNQTDAFLKIGYGDLSFRGHFLTREKGNYIGLSSALTNDSTDQDTNFWGELAYNLRLSDTVSASLKIYYDHYGQDPNVKIYPNGFANVAGTFPDGMIGKPLVKDGTIGTELQVNWDVFKGNHLIGGFSFENMQQYGVSQLANFNPLTGAPLGSVQEVANWNKDANRQIFATYVQDEWQLLEHVNLTAGVRYDHYSDFGDTVNPRAGLVWSFLDNTDLKLLYGQAFRAPSFEELYNINNPTVSGNPNLKPERIQTYEAGLAWRYNRYFATTLNYFYSYIYDQIGWTPSTTPGSPAVNENIGDTVTQGIELGANGSIGTTLHWSASYTYQDPRNANTERRLPYVPCQRATGSVNYALKFVNLHTDVLWTGTRPRDIGDTRPQMPAYATVDLATTFKNFFKTLEIQATVRNLFNTRYSDPDTSGGNVNVAGTGPNVPGDFPREGISVFVTALYRF